MNTNRSISKIMALMLSVAMMLTGMPVSAFAKAAGGCAHEHNADCGYTEAAPCGHVHDENCGGLTLGNSGDAVTDTVTITAFAELGKSVAAQTVPLGTSTSTLILPNTLNATSRAVTIATQTNAAKETDVTIPGVTWQSEPEYKPNTAGTYRLTAVLPEGYALAGGVDLPVITVEVAATQTSRTVGMGIMAILDPSNLPAGAYTIETSGQDVILTDGTDSCVLTSSSEIAVVSGNLTLTVNADVTIQAITITGGNLTINGTQALTIVNPSTGYDEGYGVYVYSGNMEVSGKLITKDCSADGIKVVLGALTISGTVMSTGNEGSGVYAAPLSSITVQNGGTLTTNGNNLSNGGSYDIFTTGDVIVYGDITVGSPGMNVGNITIGASGTLASSGEVRAQNDVTVYGTLTSSNGASSGIGVYGSLVVDGGTVTANNNTRNGVYVAGGDITIENGGTLTANSNTYPGIYVEPGYSLYIDGGEVTANNNPSNGIYMAGGSITVENGGTLTTNGNTSPGVWVVGSITVGVDGTLTGENAASTDFRASNGFTVDGVLIGYGTAASDICSGSVTLSGTGVIIAVDSTAATTQTAGTTTGLQSWKAGDALSGGGSGAASWALVGGKSGVTNSVNSIFVELTDFTVTPPATNVTFTAAQTGGTSGTVDSTGIVLTFSEAVTGLTAGDITLSSGTGAAVTGTLSGSGTTWTIALASVTTQGDVAVSVANFGAFNVTTGVQTVAVYKDNTPPAQTPTASDLTYTIPTGRTYTGLAQDIGSVSGIGLGAITVYYEGTNYLKSITAPTGAGTYAVTADVTGGTNYSEATGLELGSYTIGKATLTITSGTVAPKIYDGTATASITDVIFDGLQGGDQLTIDADYIVTNAHFNSPTVPNADTVTAAVTLLSTSITSNYILASGAFTKTNVSILRYKTNGIDQIYWVTTNNAHEYFFDMNSILPAGMAADTGKTFFFITYTNNDGVLATTPNGGSVSGSTLTLDVANVTGEGKTAEIVIGFYSENYEIFSPTITVKTTDKSPVSITANVSSRDYDGNPYAYSGVVIKQNTNNAVVNDVTPEVSYTGINAGGMSYGPSATPPTYAGSYTLTLKVPDSNPTYAGSSDFNFTINKRPITLVADRKSVLVGDSLPMLTYTVQNLAPGESASNAFITEPILACPTFDGNTAGNYPIAMTGGTLYTNYTIAGRTNGLVTVATQTYAVTVVNGSGSGSFAPSVTVSITANTAPSGQTFDQWTTTSNGVTFASASSATNTFTMPANAVTVTATYKSTGGNGGGGSGSSNSGSGNSGGGLSYTPPGKPITTEKQPNAPTVSKHSVTGTVKNKILTVIITEKMAEDAIAAAQMAAKNAGKTADGIAVRFEIGGAGDYESVRVIYERAALEALEAADVKYSQVSTKLIDISLDAKAISETLFQTGGDVTVSALRQTNLSNASKASIGSRPAFDITLKGSKGAIVSDLKGGAATIGIAYNPTGNEKTGYLYGVYVDKNGNPQLLNKSSYNNGKLIFKRNSLSVYGVGYKTPAPSFTDTATHWAKDAIDFVASRDLIFGATASTFAPDATITHGTFLMALGKLSGADMSGYKTSSFTDVKRTNPAMPYIEWAVKNNIVQGIGNNKFGPNQKITREQMAVMMANYANATGYKLPVSRTAVTFADDAKISAWAKDAVKTIQQAGIISGKGNNIFDPLGNATRAEASTLLRRFVALVIDEDTARGWSQNDSGQRQYIHTNGKATTGWLTAGDNQYYFDAKGVMVSGKWIQIDGKWYYFHADGKLAVNTTIDGYEVGADGARKKK